MAGPTVATIFVRRMSPDYHAANVEPWTASSSPGCARWACTASCPRSRAARSRSRSTSSCSSTLAPRARATTSTTPSTTAAVCEAVSRVVSSEQYRLLERLATRIAEVCRADPRVVERGRRGAQVASAGARAAGLRRRARRAVSRAYLALGSNLGDRGRASAVRGRRARRRGRGVEVRRRVARVRDRAGRRPAAGRVPERGGRDRDRTRPARAARARHSGSNAMRTASGPSAGGRARSTSTCCCTTTCRVDEPDLTVPHPRMWERGFVLAPLRDVAPDAGRRARTREHPWEGVRGGGGNIAHSMAEQQRTVALIGPGRAGTTIAIAPAGAGLDVVGGRRSGAGCAVDHRRRRVPRFAPRAGLRGRARRGARARRHARPRDRAGARSPPSRRSSPARSSCTSRVRAASTCSRRCSNGARASGSARCTRCSRSRRRPPGVERLAGAWAAVAGDPGRRRHRAIARDAARSSSPTPTASRYHAAAVVASNHLVALLGQVERLAATCGVPFEAFAPARARVGRERVRARARPTRSPARSPAATCDRRAAPARSRPGRARRVPRPGARGRPARPAGATPASTACSTTCATHPGTHRDDEPVSRHAPGRRSGRIGRRATMTWSDPPVRTRRGRNRARPSECSTSRRSPSCAPRAIARGPTGTAVGLVPTMGFLHEGHRSLMRAARAACDFVVVTIFVNPLQFGAGEDLDRYPRDLAGDLAQCEAEGVDCVFTPSRRRDVPERPPLTTVHVAGLTADLCGAARPTHFDGVAHGGHEAVRDRRPVRGLLRPQGRAAARGGHAHGRRPQPAGRGRRLPDRARARRARAVEPQRVPLARRSPGRARALARARGRGRRRSSPASAIASALVDLVRGSVVDRARGRARVRRGRATAHDLARGRRDRRRRCCSRSRPGSARPV